MRVRVKRTRKYLPCGIRHGFLAEAADRLRKRLARLKAGEAVKEQDPLVGVFEGHLETGFQLATFQGPLCAEPVEGMAYFVEAVTLDRAGIEEEQSTVSI